MQGNTKIKRNEIQNKMSNNLVGFSVEVKITDKSKGTFIRNNTDEGKIEIFIDPRDRLDLFKQLNGIIMDLQANHPATKVGCIDCSKEVIISGKSAGSSHKVDFFCCPECGGDLINLDGELE